MNDASIKTHLRGPFRIIVRLLLFGLPIIAVVVVLGTGFGREWKEFEKWIAEIGFWGPLVLILATAILIVAMFPDTPFSMAAGALYGIGWGSVYAALGALIGASATFWFSRLYLRSRVQRFLASRPRWSAIESAAGREGLRLQLLIRLTPMHSASFSYVMGASRLAYQTFAIGSLGMIPLVVVEVYAGHAAGHAARLASGTAGYLSWTTLVTFGGLAVTLGVMGYVIVVARRAIAESEVQAGSPNAV